MTLGMILLIILILAGLIGAGIGAGLILSSGRTIRLFGMMNRYVSTRRGMKPLSMPHDVEPSVRKHRNLVGILFVLGAAFSIYGLVAWFDSSAIVAALALPYPRAFTVWILDCVRWSLIVLNLFAVVIGLMLVGLPGTLTRFEALMNRWYSFRALTAGSERMHLPLDRLVAAYPRSAGSIIVVTALAVAANATILWLRFP